MLVTKPGIYPDVDFNEYLADVCPDASLNASIAKVLIEQSPRHAWHAHPRLNTRWEQREDKKFDVANVAHTLLLGRGKKFVAAPFDAWTTKASKSFRETAQLAGQIAVLDKHLDLARAMVSAAVAQLTEQGCPEAFGRINGKAEVMVVGQQETIWLRCLIDWISNDLLHVYDYKTTKGSASPAAIEYKMVEDGWDIQAAMQEKVLDVADPVGAGHRHWRFVLQEAYEPFALTVAELPETVMDMGRRKLGTAIDKWSQCIKSGKWPSYSEGVVRPLYPTFKEQQWVNREVDSENGQ